jgi:signal transduction histidine kinase
MNLVSNAFKFTIHGRVTLYSSVDPDQSAVLIGVRDTGPGIAADHLTVIFERFKQAGTRLMRSQGVGLGLAISKELVELHQGKIWVESELGVGSDFKFTLPLSQT